MAPPVTSKPKRKAGNCIMGFAYGKADYVEKDFSAPLKVNPLLEACDWPGPAFYDRAADLQRFSPMMNEPYSASHWRASKSRRTSFLLMCFRTILIAAAPVAFMANAAAGKENDDHALRLTQAMLDDLQSVTHAPGMAIAVHFGDGRQYCVVTGYANLEDNKPVNCRTQFRLASVSKVFAMTAAAKLFADGKLDLEAPVSAYAPYFTLDDRVTPIDLASHMSGLPHQGAPGGNNTMHYDSVREGWDAYGERRLQFDPGTGYLYSTMGYTLLSAVIEGASGRNYLDYLRSEILTPFGLEEIGAEDVTNPHPFMSESYLVSGSTVSKETPHDYSYSWGGAGMRSNAPDLAAFGSLYFGEQMLDQQTKAMMFTPARLDNGETVGRYYYRVGFGWRLGEDFRRRRIVHHAGVAKGARSALVIYPDDKTSISFLSNARWTASIERTATTLAASFQAANPVQSRRHCPVMDNAYAGTFDGDAITGRLTIRFEDNLCVGRLTADNSIGEWLWRDQPLDEKLIRLHFIENSGHTSLLAFVTPYGVSDATLVIDDKGCGIAGYLGRQSTFDITIKGCNA